MIKNVIIDGEEYELSQFNFEKLLINGALKSKNDMTKFVTGQQYTIESKTEDGTKYLFVYIGNSEYVLLNLKSGHIFGSCLVEGDLKTMSFSQYNRLTAGFKFIIA